MAIEHFPDQTNKRDPRLFVFGAAYRAFESEGRTLVLLPLRATQKEPIEVGDIIGAVPFDQSPRYLPLLVTKVTTLRLLEVLDADLDRLCASMAIYLSRWDECNPEDLAATEPEIIRIEVTQSPSFEAWSNAGSYGGPGAGPGGAPVQSTDGD